MCVFYFFNLKMVFQERFRNCCYDGINLRNGDEPWKQDMSGSMRSPMAIF